MQLKNFAAWIPSERGQISVAPALFPKCGRDELIIKSHVLAINPVDWKIQTLGGFSVTYPAILGEDVAGEILEVGSDLKSKFQIGQRVMAHTMWSGKGPAYGGFQLYPLLTGPTTALIPDHISFIEAAALPLSISTAAAGLFMSTALGLEYPKTGLNHAGPLNNADKLTPTLLLWGGSSSVGSTVIQMASAAGYAVITTASPSNFQYCKKLGANHVVDYQNPEAISNLISLMKGKIVAGSYDAIGTDTTIRQCASILHALGGGKVASVGSTPKNVFEDVTICRVSAGTIVMEEPEVAQRIWGEYVPRALKSGELVPSPKALVTGKGLKDVQRGIKRQKLGVSARKVEIVLEC